MNRKQTKAALMREKKFVDDYVHLCPSCERKIW